MAGEVWAAGDAYEPYVGRWSRLVARQFLDWLAVPSRQQWLDVGCGTGALSECILANAAPARLAGIDPSAGFLEHARARMGDARASFKVADARDTGFDEASFDVVVSGLVLNFVPQTEKAVAEMRRVARPGGTVAAYVWDYGGMMQLMRHFWNAAAALDGAAAELDEGRRFPVCAPQPLQRLFEGQGLREVRTHAIDIVTHFRDFDDYWNPFLGGQGPAPGYAMSLSEDRRARLRERLRESLPVATDGSIPLVARAWAVRGAK
jgi:SAM-dependent methyltransferase